MQCVSLLVLTGQLFMVTCDKWHLEFRNSCFKTVCSFRNYVFHFHPLPCLCLHPFDTTNQESKRIIKRADCCITVNKSKSCPTTRHEGAWAERRYSSYSFSTSALDRGEWTASRPAALYRRGKDPRYPLYRRLGGLQSRYGHRG
jgi:hypothetical protein